MSRVSIFVLLFLGFAVSAQATEVVTEEEGILKGKIIGKEGAEIFFETDSGIINIRKADIISIDGKPYVYAPKPAVMPEPPPAPAAEVPAVAMETDQPEAANPNNSEEEKES